MVTGIFLFCKVKTPPPSQTWLWLPSTVDIPEANITYLEKVTEICFMIWGAMTKNKTLKRTCVLRNHFALCQKHSVPVCWSLAGFPGWLSWHLHGSAAQYPSPPSFLLCVAKSGSHLALRVWSLSPSLLQPLHFLPFRKRCSSREAWPYSCTCVRHKQREHDRTYTDKYQSK